MDQAVRQWGGKKLAAFLKANASEGLIPALTDVVFFQWDTQIRKAAVEALLSMKSRDTVEGLVWALRDRLEHPPLPEIREAILERGDAGVIPFLQEMPPESLENLRARPARTPPVRLPTLLAPDASKELLIRALVTGSLADPETPRRILPLFQHSNREVRFRAVAAFTYISAPAIEPLASVLGNSREVLVTRQMAAIALSRQPQKERARDVLKEALRFCSEPLKSSIQQSIDELNRRKGPSRNY
jgi:HEAT repeat protein